VGRLRPRRRRESTYFKPDPKRLLALLNALKAEKNRREAILGKLGKSKMTVDTIEKLGGIELLIVDELATYTRPGPSAA
jgi:S-DNA-T family DNA segregation ATPase FtsK/SpoIIIE